MIRNINLSSSVTIEDVASWPTAKEELVTFRVTRDSGFALFAESSAIAMLAQMQQAGMSISAECTFLPHLGGQESLAIGIFSGLFGIALLSAATHIKDPSGRDHKSVMLQTIWSEVVADRGNIGDGKKRTIVSRDPDAPLPQCLLESHTATFPSREKFKALIVEVARQLGAGGAFGQTDRENQIADFLYEAAYNSHEHGRTDAAGRAQKGFRGIISEKLIATSLESLLARAVLPRQIRDFVEAVWRSSNRKSMLLLSFTVADCGAGIHNTLPGGKEESEWDRLERAFRSGESRKPRASDIGRGQGLVNIVRSCAHLKAFLYVRSAELSGSYDFSMISTFEDTLPPLTRWELPATVTRIGTSLTLLWLTAVEDARRQRPVEEDQATLF